MPTQNIDFSGVTTVSYDGTALTEVVFNGTTIWNAIVAYQRWYMSLAAPNANTTYGKQMTNMAPPVYDSVNNSYHWLMLDNASNDANIDTAFAVFKVNPAGVVQWRKCVGAVSGNGSVNQGIFGPFRGGAPMCVSSAGQLTIAGGIHHGWGGSNHNHGAVLYNFNPDGTFNKSTTFTTNHNDSYQYMTGDTAGNIYLARDADIIKMDKDFSVSWSKQMGTGSGSDYKIHCLHERDGILYGGGINNVDKSKVHIYKMNASSGANVWAKSIYGGWNNWTVNIPEPQVTETKVTTIHCTENDDIFLDVSWRVRTDNYWSSPRWTTNVQQFVFTDAGALTWITKSFITWQNQRQGATSYGDWVMTMDNVDGGGNFSQSMSYLRNCSTGQLGQISTTQGNFNPDGDIMLHAKTHVNGSTYTMVSFVMDSAGTTLLLGANPGGTTQSYTLTNESGLGGTDIFVQGAKPYVMEGSGTNQHGLYTIANLTTSSATGGTHGQTTPSTQILSASSYGDTLTASVGSGTL
tara:strand:- start:35 stop:1591 length:1557 start_codon:yes stop_codon:yes gene_type:complete